MFKLLFIASLFFYFDGVGATSKEKSVLGKTVDKKTALRLANALAVKSGYKLDQFETPRVEVSKDNQKIIVFYEGKVPAPGHHFLVNINRKSGEAVLLKGE